MWLMQIRRPVFVLLLIRQASSSLSACCTAALVQRQIADKINIRSHWRQWINRWGLAPPPLHNQYCWCTEQCWCKHTHKHTGLQGGVRSGVWWLTVTWHAWHLLRCDCVSVSVWWNVEWSLWVKAEEDRNSGCFPWNQQILCCQLQSIKVMQFMFIHLHTISHSINSLSAAPSA